MKKYPKSNKLAERYIEHHKKELELILNIVCDAMQLHPERVKSKERYRPLVIARHIFCYLVKKFLPKVTYKTIGVFLGRDHTTAINSILMVENGIFTKDVLFKDIYRLEEEVKLRLLNENTKVIFSLPIGVSLDQFITTTTSNYEQIKYEIIY